MSLCAAIVLAGWVAPAKAAVGTLVFSDSFSDVSKWHLTSEISMYDFSAWQLDGSKFVSGPYSLSHSPYGTYENSQASTRIDLRGASSATLRFNAWYNTRPDKDFCYVWVWPDGGYNEQVAVIHGTSGGAFVPMMIDISKFAGQQVELTFGLQSTRTVEDYWLSYGGIRIDDVQVWKDGVGTSSTAPSGARITRTPSGSSKSYKRKKGTARYTLGASVRASDGSPVEGLKVTLQTSKNGKTKWKNSYAFVTGANGAVSKRFAVRKKGTTYYRWVASGAPTTGKQKVVVK